jgi:hypothetical protein
MALIVSTSGAIASTSTEILNSQILDQVISAHSVELSQADLKSIPNSIICAKGTDSTTKINDLQTSYKILRADESKTSVIIQLSEGDQVAGYMLLLEDLQNLDSKKVKTIVAKSFEGFWYSDGNHYGFSDQTVLCELN